MACQSIRNGVESPVLPRKSYRQLSGGPNYEGAGPYYPEPFGPDAFVPSSLDRTMVKTEIPRAELSKGDCTAC
jgi:hypothetical protein